MSYSFFSIIALLVNLVINFDVIFRKRKNYKVSALRPYRYFLMTIGVFYISDILWGIFDQFHLMKILYADTVLFFLTMGFSLLAWCWYVTLYLNEHKTLNIIIRVVGVIFTVMAIVFLIVNIFVPALFYFNDDYSYSTGPMRYAYFGAQILLFTTISLYSYLTMRNQTSAVKRRHAAIGGFGVIMSVSIALQLYFPLLPLYAAGSILGVALVHTFVVADEKREYRDTIKEISEREQAKDQALGSARLLAYTDSLTGVKSKHAYVEKEDEIDSLIRENKMPEFALIVFDLNDLKVVNDTHGHQAGDKYIKDSVKIITKYFSHSEIYRFGGDEFVSIVQGEDFANRYKILSTINSEVEANLNTNKPIIATGISDYNPKKDNTLRSIFIRADDNMYARKRMLKEMTSR